MGLCGSQPKHLYPSILTNGFSMGVAFDMHSTYWKVIALPMASPLPAVGLPWGVITKKRKRVAPGQPPGSLEEAAGNTSVRITVTDYNEPALSRVEVGSAELGPPQNGTRRWIQIQGAPTTDALHALGEQFGVHALVLEDIVSSEQRIKAEDHEHYLFTVLRAPASSAAATAFHDLSILLFEATLITIHEEPNADSFAPINKRLDNPGSLVRRNAVDFLFEAVVDLTVDSFFLTLEELEEQAAGLENAILDQPQSEQLKQLHRLREQTRRVRSVLWASRDVVARVQRAGTPLLTPDTLYYFRDVHDHVIHLIDAVTMIRETANGLMELYMSGVSNKMNEVMKVLTIISTLFIPLSFLAGVYGMNFAFMPELQVRWAYPVLLGLMGLIAGGMLLFFKRRKWF